jgi:carbonic anhydrase
LTLLDELLERNRTYAQRHEEGLPPLPRRGLVVLTCMDHRIDPVAALGLDVGDAMVIRNAGGRVTPNFLQNLQVLGLVAENRGSEVGALELVLMQHTQCGVGALMDAHPDALATYFDVPPDQLASLAPDDPHEGIRADIEILAADPAIPSSLAVTGLVFDVATGEVELVERRAPLRDAA